VKGRLQPTKSIGDLFLKHKEFNEIVNKSEQSQKYCKKILQNFNGPYIEHLPEVMRFELSEKDEFIVLASDGLWDWLDGYEVAEILEKFCLDGAKAIEELYKSALAKAADKINLSIDELEQLPMSVRRSIYDDISIIIVDLKNQTKSSR
jgi:pyruvate dehydrogenase phosphatase